MRRLLLAGLALTAVGFVVWLVWAFFGTGETELVGAKIAASTVETYPIHDDTEGTVEKANLQLQLEFEYAGEPRRADFVKIGLSEKEKALVSAWKKGRRLTVCVLDRNPQSVVPEVFSHTEKNWAALAEGLAAAVLVLVIALANLFKRPDQPS